MTEQQRRTPHVNLTLARELVVAAKALAVARHLSLTGLLEQLIVAELAREARKAARP